MSSPPNTFALIIGAMKCGTTSLFYYLSEHPQVAACKHKELNYFVDEQLFAKGLTWYQSMWPGRGDHQIALEASPRYTMLPEQAGVVERIAATKDSNFRFLYIIRHPFKRIESHIVQQLSKGELQRDEVGIRAEHIALSQYAMQLDAYSKAFGRDKVHVVLLEELQQNQQAVLSEVCKFLQIDPNYQFSRIDVVRNSRDTLNLHPVLNQMRHFSLMRPLVKQIPPRFRQFLRGKLSRQDPFLVELSERDRAIALEKLRPDLVRLESEYGVDVQGKWGLSLAARG